MTIIPVSMARANAFVLAHHRHLDVSRGCKWCLGVTVAGELRGVVIVGRPVARALDDGVTAEVTRLCTDGTANACSKLLGAARRTARAMGYARLITYTLAAEGGASLRASNFELVAETRAEGWDRPGRRRARILPTAHKLRWQLVL